MISKLSALCSRQVNLSCPLQGTQIEGSVWRDLADKYHDLLEESKVSHHPLPLSCNESSTFLVYSCQVLAGN